MSLKGYLPAWKSASLESHVPLAGRRHHNTSITIETSDNQSTKSGPARPQSRHFPDEQPPGDLKHLGFLFLRSARCNNCLRHHFLRTSGTAPHAYNLALRSATPNQLPTTLALFSNTLSRTTAKGSWPTACAGAAPLLYACPHPAIHSAGCPRR